MRIGSGFNGKIDEIKVFQRALEDEEAWQHMFYSDELNATHIPELLAHYALNDAYFVDYTQPFNVRIMPCFSLSAIEYIRRPEP